jgi:tetratricopeptide (TPR) repeat protein
MIAAIPFPCWANPETAFDAANRLYEEGKYAEAAAAYEQLSQTNPGSAALLFNRGNAFFKAGQVGRAIVAYREAQAIAPRDPDIRANLRFARDRVRGPTLAISRLDQWLGRMTLNEWTVLTTALLWLWILLLTLFQWKPRLRSSMRWYALGLGGALLFCGACLGISLWGSRATNVAVITSGGTVHQGPFEGSPSAFAVQDGAELLVLDRKQGWLQVSNGQRSIGWLPQDQAVVTSGGSRS